MYHYFGLRITPMLLIPTHPEPKEAVERTSPNHRLTLIIKWTPEVYSAIAGLASTPWG